LLNIKIRITATIPPTGRVSDLKAHLHHRYRCDCDSWAILSRQTSEGYHRLFPVPAHVRVLFHGNSGHYYYSPSPRDHNSVLAYNPARVRSDHTAQTDAVAAGLRGGVGADTGLGKQVGELTKVVEESQAEEAVVVACDSVAEAGY